MAFASEAVRYRTAGSLGPLAKGLKRAKADMSRELVLVLSRSGRRPAVQ